jgi:hypothetical protein
MPGTATTVDRWLVLEVPGSWPRDVESGDGVPDAVQSAVSLWLRSASERRRALFVRRPGRPAQSLLAFVVHAAEAATEVRRLELGGHDELARVDLEHAGTRVQAQLVLVCGHGSRDACCALRGTAVYGALADRLGDEELWISSHQGGHRFAANVLVLPAGLQLGRVEPGEAPLVVAGALDGRIELGRYRGRTCYSPPVQAAEHAVRVANGLDGVADLHVAGSEGSIVRFLARDGRELAARVEEHDGPVVPPSCGVEAEPQRTLVAHPL